ncbi:exonuclease domain-containing protein [Bacillus thuringiensis]|uniref:exonuclease domain-containing protein n=1 Tax=Bacillus thuringiensis TaxID=1428 RepID=UPI0011A55156|nr:3'-5' exonuclease [Bacillus thuringiensis]
MEKIHGWSNVPKGIHTKTQLREMGLKPGKDQEVVAEIYVQGRSEWCNLYKKEDCVAIKRMSDEQKENLRKSHEKFYCKNCRRKDFKIKTVKERFKSYLKRDETTTMLCIEKYLEDRYCEGCAGWLYDEVRLTFFKKELSTRLREQTKDGFLALKVETTGLDYTDEIIQIAIINQDKEVLFQSYVKPTVLVDPDAKSLHGKSNVDLKDEPMWTEIYPKIKEIIEGKMVFVFNADFVSEMLEQTCERYKVPMIKANYRCVMWKYSRYIGMEEAYVNMTYAADEPKTNEAVHDCLLVHKILCKMMKEE